MQVRCRRCGATISWIDAKAVEGTQPNDRGGYVCKDLKACNKRVKKKQKDE